MISGDGDQADCKGHRATNHKPGAGGVGVLEQRATRRLAADRAAAC